MPKTGVYRIDLGAGRFYIGSALNLPRRERHHRRALEGGRHHNRIVQHSFDKYCVFEFSVVEICPADQLLAVEQLLLDQHFDDPKCANMAPTAGSSLGRKHSPESLAKISAANTGKKFSLEHRAKISAANLGSKRSPQSILKMSVAQQNRSPESREKTSAALLGRKLSPETKAKMSASHKGKKRSPEQCAKMSAAQTARWARDKVVK